MLSFVYPGADNKANTKESSFFPMTRGARITMHKVVLKEQKAIRIDAPPHLLGVVPCLVYRANVKL